MDTGNSFYIIFSEFRLWNTMQVELNLNFESYLQNILKQINSIVILTFICESFVYYKFPRRFISGITHLSHGNDSRMKIADCHPLKFKWTMDEY